MIYGKLTEDNNLYIAPKRLVIGQNVVYNPTAEQYLKDGYKAIIYTNPPKVQNDSYCVPYWVEDENNITQEWEILKKPNEISDDEAFAIIMGVES